MSYKLPALIKEARYMTSGTTHCQNRFDADMTLPSLMEIFLATCTLLFVGSAAVNINTTTPTLSCKLCSSLILTDNGVCELDDPRDAKVYLPCRCDSDCEVYGDCCESTPEGCFNASRLRDENRSFKCQNIFVGERNDNSTLPGSTDQFWMVSSCSNGWRESHRDTVDKQVIEDNCNGNPLNLPPVTDLATGLVYQNEYCAACNEVNNFVTWDIGFTCKSDLEDQLNDLNYNLTASEFNRYCNISLYISPFLNPDVSVLHPRQCYPQIDTCLELDALLDGRNGAISWNSSYYNYVKHLCMESSFQNHVVQKGQKDTIPFRNEYCALCNNVDPGSIACFEAPDGIRFGSFTIILDVYGRGVIMSTFLKTLVVQVFCTEEAEVFDPVSRECISTLQIDKCNSSNGLSRSDGNCTNCTGELITLVDSTVYAIADSNTLVYNNELYAIESNTSDGAPIICVNFSTNGTQIVTDDARRFTYPLAYVILTYIGCPLSILGCCMILVTYALFKELRTLPSQILMQLAIAILIGNLVVIISGPIVERIENADVLCAPVAILTHYIFLAIFSWMSLMSTEIARNMYSASRMKTKHSDGYKIKLLLSYTLIGWCTPLLIVLLTVIVNFTTTDLVLYGELADGTRGRCWINHPVSVIVAFIVPMAASLIYNAVLFVIITVFLCKSSRSKPKVSDKRNTSFLRLNVAVFSVSGLTWMFGLLALVPQFEWAWIPYIILNSTQGFVVFVFFTCTRRVARLYKSLIYRQKEEK